MTSYWLSTHCMTIRVTVDDDDGRVVKASIQASTSTTSALVFVGRPFAELENWLRKQGGYVKTRLEEQ